jgi:hypothetical protein
MFKTAVVVPFYLFHDDEPRPPQEFTEVHGWVILIGGILIAGLFIREWLDNRRNK